MNNVSDYPALGKLESLESMLVAPHISFLLETNTDVLYQI